MLYFVPTSLASCHTNLLISSRTDATFTGAAVGVVVALGGIVMATLVGKVHVVAMVAGVVTVAGDVTVTVVTVVTVTAGGGNSDGGAVLAVVTVMAAVATVLLPLAESALDAARSIQ